MAPLFVLTPDRPSRNLPFISALREGLGNLYRTARDLRARRGLVLFLLANMLYADGLATLFALGGVYVAGTFGMGMAKVIVFGLVLNMAAGIGAFVFGWVDDWIGSRRTIALALTGLIVAGIAAVSVRTEPCLWATGCLLGLFVGPVQASSRSLMARLSPIDRQAEYFGLLALSSKATAFAGPVAAAVVTEATGSQRLGLATILVFLGGGFLLLRASGRHGES
jgi:UMF1 family MFS transporter